jgi:acetolactate synthase-1/2/3 large subunit
VIADLPLNAYWVLRYVRTRGEERFVMNTGFGAMGYAVPAGLGAWLARTERHGSGERVVVTTGDGGLLMSVQEIHAAVAESAAITIVVFNNSTLGAPSVLSDRERRRRVAVDLPPTDFVGVARAFGADGRRVTTPAELDQALAWAAERGGPTVIDAIIDPAAQPTPCIATMRETR